MSRRELAMVTEREKMLDTLITKYGHESEPVLFFAENAWKFISNREVYFRIAMNWTFVER